MQSNMVLILGAVILSAGLTACSGEIPAAGPSGLEIRLEAMNDGQAPCQIERSARVNQANHSLYMVRGEGRYRSSDGQRRDIPVQIRFLGVDGVKDEETITMTDLDASCDQVAIEWEIEYCQNQARDRVECPEFQISGQDQFSNFSLGFESP